MVIEGPGPALVPVVLHVEDKGKFEVSSEDSMIKGKINVIVHGTGGDETGSTLLISKGQATLAAFEKEKKPKHGD